MKDRSLLSTENIAMNYKLFLDITKTKSFNGYKFNFKKI